MILEGLSVCIIYMFAIMSLFCIALALYYCGVVAIYLMYKHNGGRYGLRKFMRTRGLDI